MLAVTVHRTVTTPGQYVGLPGKMGNENIPCLSLWERCPSIGRTERVYAESNALSVTFGDSSPKERAKLLRPWNKGYNFNT